MSIIQKLIHPLVSIENKSSKDQIKDDFGEFPPIPLRCDNIAGYFKIVKASPIGEIFIEYKILKSLLNISEEEFNNRSDVISNDSSLSKLLHAQEIFRNISGGSKRIEEILINVSFIWRLSKKLIFSNKYKSERQLKGYFNPFLEDGSQIVINSRFNNKKSVDAIISHEHIHLLQFRNPENHIRKARLPADFFCKDMRTDPHLLYIMEKKEFEARLHEVVISFYRTHRVLPLTVSGFLGLISACEHIGSLVTPLLEINQTSFVKYEDYPARESRPIEHLEEILVYIENLDMSFRFITEVVTVMYGNLLRYYGSEEDSSIYMKEIKRPNLYDELYGKNIGDGTGLA